MRAYYRNKTIRDHRRPGRHWYTVDGFALRFASSAAAVRWIDATLEAGAGRCRSALRDRRTHTGVQRRGVPERLGVRQADRRRDEAVDLRVLGGASLV